MNTIQFPTKINLLIAALRPNTPTVKQRFLAYFAPLAVQLKAYFTTIINLLISVLHTNTLAVIQRFFKFLGPYAFKTQVKLLLFTILSTTTIQAQNNITSNKLDMEQMQNNKESVRQFFQHLENENITEFIAMFAEEGSQENPYASGIFPSGAKGKEALTQYWEPVPANFDGMEFIIEELLGTENPNVVYVKYTGKIKLKNDAGYYENQYFSTFTFNEDGKILNYVEIFNPIVAAKAFGLEIQ